MENPNPVLSAASASSSAFSSSSSPKEYYDVFLSFRGEDTRNNFTGYLRDALRQKGFHTFFDDDKLERGKEINPELLKAIEDSQCSIIVLSENYAYSSWCLTELTKIVECKGTSSGKILPIFYHVDPGHVRNQTGSYGEAFKKHEQDAKHSSQKVQSWRNALKTVGNLAGWHVTKDKPEPELIKDFIVQLSRKLDVASLNISQVLFGMDSRLEKFKSCFVSSSSDTVRFIGICGMGGIGKTTLAKVYYNQVFDKFDGCSFLANVRETCEKREDGLVYLQTQLLSNILKEKDIEIENVDRGMEMIRRRLRHKRVLIVLDDVKILDQLEALADQKDDRLGPGSIIIVTTRDESLLRSNGISTIIKTEQLNSTEALQLFSWKAFKSIDPPEDYKEQCKQVIEYAKGLPLALSVLGSFLSGKRRNEWESALNRLREYQKKEIIEALKISFYDLEGIDQRIFLDIACFFNEFDKDHVIEILDSCGFDSKYGISNLIEKSLLSIQHNKLHMHDLLQEMGREIVLNESRNEPGKRSRIWNVVDFYDILENETGTEKVEAIVTFTKGSREFRGFEAISHMKNLRLLMLLEPYNLSRVIDGLSPDLEYLSNELRLLQWDRFPYRSFPSGFRPHRLVQLKLFKSSIEKLWNNNAKPLRNLKIIDLSKSEYFISFEDFTVVPNLERLILDGCINLLEIHDSITSLEKLSLLNLASCRKLKKFPKKIKGMNSLEILNLYFCRQLRELPEDFEHLKSLKEVDLRFSGIRHLLSSIFLKENLKVHCDEEVANSSMRERIINPPIGYCLLSDNLRFLKKLDLSDCNLLDEALPEHFEELVCLEELDLSNNPFSVLPPNIKGLSRLKYLNLMYCEFLRYLSPHQLPSSLETVRVDYCTSLNSFLDPSEPRHLRCSAYCVDCFELVERQGGEVTAFTALKRYIQAPPYRTRQFGIVVSGSEIPTWFTRRSSGEPILVKLNPTKKWMGFAFAACFGASTSNDGESCYITVGLKFRKPRLATSTQNIYRRRSNHLWISYLPRGYNFKSEPQLVLMDTTSGDDVLYQQQPICDDQFVISFFPGNGRNSSSCGPYGVRLVYENDIEELNQIISNYSNKPFDGQEDIVHHSPTKWVEESLINHGSFWSKNERAILGAILVAALVGTLVVALRYKSQS